MQKGIPTGQCSVCRHPEHARIDYLVASGGRGTLSAIARQFRLKKDAICRHSKNHISPEYRRAVKIGPFASETQLRKLCAESGTSVLENMRAIYSGLASRWLAAFEAEADSTLGMLTGRMHENLETQARLTKEYLPPPTSVTNVFLSPGFIQVQAALLRVLRKFPEAHAEVIREFRDIETQASVSPPMIEARAEAVRAA